MPALLEKATAKPLTDPVRLFDWMRDEIDRLFEPTWTRLTPVLPRAETRWMPALEVFENKGELHVKADLPGMKKDDIAIEATIEGLTIRGERKTEMREEKEGYFRSECAYGEFRRFVPLPEGAVIDKIEARFTDGVLHVVIPVPKLEKALPKAIPIK